VPGGVHILFYFIAILYFKHSGMSSTKVSYPMYKHTGCAGGNVPDFGRMSLKIKYTDITKYTYIRS